MTSAAFTYGFLAGLVKAASGDNQPGPMPQRPSPPDGQRKRNVALGAAVLTAGVLGARHAKVQWQRAGELATKARAQTGKVILDRMRKGDHVGAEVGRWREGLKTAPGVKEKARAWGQDATSKIRSSMSQRARDLGHQRFMAENKIRDLSDEAKATRREAAKVRLSKIKANGTAAKIRRRVIGIGAGTAGVVGGAVAGASGASKAKEEQSDDQPGLGR